MSLLGLRNDISSCILMMNRCMSALHLQIILALGNYMNSSKRGAVYGFKLQSLDLVRPSLTPYKSARVLRAQSGHMWAFLSLLSWRSEQRWPLGECKTFMNPISLDSIHFQLLDTKSTDRKQTLLHYIANVVREKYQQVSLFYNEIHYVEKAAAGEVLEDSRRQMSSLQ